MKGRESEGSRNSGGGGNGGDGGSSGGSDDDMVVESDGVGGEEGAASPLTVVVSAAVGGWVDRDGLMVAAVAVAWVGFSVRAAAPCRTRTTHPDAAGVATAPAIAGENVLAENTVARSLHLASEKNSIRRLRM